MFFFGFELTEIPSGNASQPIQPGQPSVPVSPPGGELLWTDCVAIA